MVATRRSDKKTVYKAGKKVEVLKRSGVVIGTLVKSLSPLAENAVVATMGERSSNNHRRGSPTSAKGGRAIQWVVKVGGHDETCSERILGRMMDDDAGTQTTTMSESETSNSNANKRTDQPTRRQQQPQEHQSNSLTSVVPTMVSLPASPVKPVRKARVSLPLPKKQTTSTATSHTRVTRARVGTRSSGPAQFKGIEDVEKLLHQSKSDPRRVGKQSSAKTTMVGKGGSDNVVKIPMKTGTLFIHRGKKRSAKFVPFK